MVYEIRYKDPEGEEGVYITNLKWLLDDIASLAKEIAKEDMCDSGGDLDDPVNWPRRYEILIDDFKWVKVSVDMEYIPQFSSICHVLLYRHSLQKTLLCHSGKWNLVVVIQNKLFVFLIFCFVFPNKKCRCLSSKEK